MTIHIADPSQNMRPMQIGVKRKDMQEIRYGTCDFSGTDSQFAGMTKVIAISKRGTGIHDTNHNPIVSYSANSNAFRFDKRYHGKYVLTRLNGVVEKEISFDADQINIDMNKKGVYLLSLFLDGERSFVRKLIVK